MFTPALTEHYVDWALERTPKPLGVLIDIIRQEIIEKDYPLTDEQNEQIVEPAIETLISGRKNLEELVSFFSSKKILCITPVPNELERRIRFYTEWARRNRRQKEIEKEQVHQGINGATEETYSVNIEYPPNQIWERRDEQKEKLEALMAIQQGTDYSPREIWEVCKFYRSPANTNRDTRRQSGEDPRTGAERLSGQVYETCFRMGEYNANEVKGFVRPMLSLLLNQEVAWREKCFPELYEIHKNDHKEMIGLMLERVSVCLEEREQKYREKQGMPQTKQTQRGEDM